MNRSSRMIIACMAMLAGSQIQAMGGSGRRAAQQAGRYGKQVWGELGETAEGRAALEETGMLGEAATEASASRGAVSPYAGRQTQPVRRSSSYGAQGSQGLMGYRSTYMQPMGTTAAGMGQRGFATTTHPQGLAEFADWRSENQQPTAGEVGVVISAERNDRAARWLTTAIKKTGQKARIFHALHAILLEAETEEDAQKKASLITDANIYMEELGNLPIKTTQNLKEELSRISISGNIYSGMLSALKYIQKKGISSPQDLFNKIEYYRVGMEKYRTGNNIMQIIVSNDEPHTVINTMRRIARYWRDNGDMHDMAIMDLYSSMEYMESLFDRYSRLAARIGVGEQQK